MMEFLMKLLEALQQIAGTLNDAALYAYPHLVHQMEVVGVTRGILFTVLALLSLLVSVLLFWNVFQPDSQDATQDNELSDGKVACLVFGIVALVVTAILTYVATTHYLSAATAEAEVIKDILNRLPK